MDFAQALDQETSAVRSRLCKVGKILETMPAEDADTARTALQSEALATKLLERVFRNAGYPVSDSTLFRHRTGTCQCHG